MLLKPDPSWEKKDPSKLKDFERCDRFYFYRHLLGWEPETPNNHLTFGTSWHLPMEYLLLNGYDDDSVLAGYDLFEKRYRQDFSPESDEMFGAKTPTNAFIALAKYSDEYKNDLDKYDVKYTEIAGSVPISASRQLYFRMDSILRDKKTKDYSSLEHKTGSRTWQWADQWPLSIQIGTYTHVLHCLYPPETVDCVRMNATFFLARKKDNIEFMRVPVKKTLDQIQVWFYTMNHLFEQIEINMEKLDRATEDDTVMEAFSINDEGCIKYGRLCEYHDFCTAWANPLQRCQQPPLGFVERFWDPTEQEAKHEFKF